MKHKINIVTGYSNPGGSTVALVRLTNLLNETGEYDATLYGPHPWHLDQCKGDYIKNLQPSFESTLITHFCQVERSIPFKQHILACHETSVFDLRPESERPLDLSIWDRIVFVSDFQKDWQGSPEGSLVIPNVVEGIKPISQVMDPPIAGVIGSIDGHKQTHVSIQRALQAGYKYIDIFGDLTDHGYFRDKVMPYLSRDIRYLGFCNDKQAMYEGLSAVFHSSLRETFNYVQFECQFAGVDYHPLPSSDTGAELWDKDRIYEAWREIIENPISN